MALTIDDAETERLARELARRRRQDIAGVVTDALRDALARDKRRPIPPEAVEAKLKRIEAIVQEVRTLPVLDPRSPDDILGYNDQGTFD